MPPITKPSGIEHDMAQDAPTCGVIYIASGKFHTDAAVAAAQSVRDTNPWLAIDLFTDQAEAAGPFDRIVHIGDGHRRSKVDCLPETRFPRTLYLDSDTRVVDDLGPMFELLDRFDLAIAHAHARNGGRQTKVWRQEIPEAFPQHNGGVILYRGEGKGLDFMAQWRDAYYEAGFKWDQTTLRELMWMSDLAIYVLPPEYNVRYRKYLDVWEPREAVAKILHMAEFYDELEREPGALSRNESGLAKLAQRVRRRLNL
jgi:hypothetical protein